MSELLAAVRLVSQAHDRLTSLPHAMHTVDAFWPHASWTLESASKRGLVSLLDRLLKGEWPGFNRQCREKRLRHAMVRAAVGLYDVQVAEWCFSRYMPGRKVSSVCDVYELAIEYDQIPVLEWIYSTNRHRRRSAKAAATFSVKRCLRSQNENSAVELVKADYSIHTALIGGRLEDLLWMHEHRPAFFGPNLLRAAVRYGNLDAATWLVHTFPAHYFNNLKRTFAYRFDDLGAYKYNLAMVKWVFVEYAARSGKHEMLEYVYAIYTGRLKSTQTITVALRKWAAGGGPCIMDEAAGNGHLDVLEFLHSHLGRQCSSHAMNAAVGNGHLDVEHWLHDNRTEGCSKQAMNAAARNGHLQVVQWLHEN